AAGAVPDPGAGRRGSLAVRAYVSRPVHPPGALGLRVAAPSQPPHDPRRKAPRAYGALVAGRRSLRRAYDSGVASGGVASLAGAASPAVLAHTRPGGVVAVRGV